MILNLDYITKNSDIINNARLADGKYKFDENSFGFRILSHWEQGLSKKVSK